MSTPGLKACTARSWSEFEINLPRSACRPLSFSREAEPRRARRLCSAVRVTGALFGAVRGAELFIRMIPVESKYVHWQASGTESPLLFRYSRCSRAHGGRSGQLPCAGRTSLATTGLQPAGALDSNSNAAVRRIRSGLSVFSRAKDSQHARCELFLLPWLHHRLP